MNTKPPLRILLMIAPRERPSVVAQALAGTEHRIVAVIDTEEDLGAAARRVQPDAVIVETDVPTRPLLRDIRRLYDESPLPVVVFTDRSTEEEIRAAVKAGVSAYVVDGLSINRVVSVVNVAIARFLEVQALRSERDNAIAKLAERRAIERAKGILMRRRDLPENAAYDVLRRMAMSRGRRMVEVAESIITAEEALTQN